MEEKSKIEGLNEKLNSRTRYEAPEDAREPVAPVDSEAPADWQGPEIDELLRSERRTPEPYPLMKKIFTVSLLFFICALGAAGLIYFKGDNFISTKNLDIRIEGPVSVSAGSPVDLDITITNNNNAALSEVNFSIVYPEGTRSAEDGTTPLLNTKETLEALGAGEKIVKSERAVFLGSEGETKSVRVSVAYKVEGSNATFTKDKIFELTIGSSPVTVTVTRPDSVTSGETFETVIHVSANSEEVIRDVILRTEYPYGWKLVSSEPQSASGSGNVWFLGDLSPGDKKTVTLRGTLVGEDSEERTIRFFVGVGDTDDNSIDTVLSAGSMIIGINRPDIDLSLRLNGNSSAEYSAPAGSVVEGTVTIKNNLPENLLSPRVEVRLSGSALDRQSVAAQSEGFYNSALGIIYWDATRRDDFDTLKPGESRTMLFRFASLKNLDPNSGNQRIDLTVALSGRPQNGQQTKVSETRIVKIASSVDLSSRSLYSVGPLSGSGPLPPKAETATIYSLSLALANTQNDIKDARVTGTLGANVEWLGEFSPEGENISYDSGTRTVTWDVGTLESGTGFSSAKKEVYFMVSLTPSLGQVGGAPVLLSNIALTGIDAFTDTPVRITNQALTTRISTDPRYVQGDEIVVK